MRRLLTLFCSLLFVGCASWFGPKPASAEQSIEALLLKGCLPYVVDGRSESETVAKLGDREIGLDIIRLINPTPMADDHVYKVRYPGIEELYVQLPSRMCVISVDPSLTPAIILSAIEAAIKTRPEAWEVVGSDNIRCIKGSNIGLEIRNGMSSSGEKHIYIEAAPLGCPRPIKSGSVAGSE